MSEKACCGGNCVSKSSTSLLTWSDPAKSAKVFGGIVLTLLTLKYINILNIVFRLGFFVLITSALAEYAGKLALGEGLVTRFKPQYTAYASKYGDKIAEHTVSFLKSFEQSAQETVYSKDIEATLKTAGGLYILYLLTSWFSLWTLLFTSVVLAFSVPGVYLKYQTEIDAKVAELSKTAKSKAVELQKTASEKSGPLLKKAEAKLGPVGAFIKSKVPVRTASSTVGSEPVVGAEKVKLPTVPSSTPVSVPEDVTTPLAAKIDETVKSADAQFAKETEPLL
ncbi:unnamed protein product [Kuraishia capsulata CBS 1993]|uniref:Reticulon-like protein n=1 Tax=Kuraishia capsulata CBS 1993 TaxID=1382522 RepID=W6MW63_9ASCO|nr:uncharacterized protein KUCA_T00002917001 [Kuraishia capsulata CBS 1993]CDK26940.1 unnamed protein product [Kuraishia capsulata CBS 1993]